MPSLPPTVQRLQRYIVWGLILMSVVFVIMIVISIIAPSAISLQQTAFVVNFILIVLILIALSFGYWATQRNRPALAISSIIGVTLIVTLIYMLLQPSSRVAGVMIPFYCVALAIPHISVQGLRWLMGACLLVGTVIIAITIFVVGDHNPTQTEKIVSAGSTVGLLALILYLLHQFQQHLVDVSAKEHATQRELMQMRDSLEEQVTERTNELRHSLSELEDRSMMQTLLLEQVAHQREVIRAISMPILPVTNDLLVMPLIGTLDSDRMSDMQERALHALEEFRAKYLLLDITGVPLVDQIVAQGLVHVVHSARLLGSNVGLIGIRPEVAQALIQLNVSLQYIPTYRDLQTALKMLKLT